MTKKKVGRKEAEEPRETVKQVRWTEREWSQVTRAAKKAGLAPSVFIRFTVLQNTKPETE
jgi:hypothetical protein